MFVFCLLICDKGHKSKGLCLFVCVVGSGFDSTFPAFVRSRASQAEGSEGRLAQKKDSMGAGFVDTICADVCSSPTSCRVSFWSFRSLCFPSS